MYIETLGWGISKLWGGVACHLTWIATAAVLAQRCAKSYGHELRSLARSNYILRRNLRPRHFHRQVLHRTCAEKAQAGLQTAGTSEASTMHRPGLLDCTGRLRAREWNREWIWNLG